jgi:hypothetical protein
MSLSDLQKKQMREWLNEYRKTREGYIKARMANIKSRCKLKGIPFDLTYEFLDSIADKSCPVFNIDFVWKTQNKGKGADENSPTLDRVIPDLGYVKGNVVFISFLANKIKQDVTEKELYAVADWLHDKRKEVLNAFKEQPTPVPRPPDTPGRKSPAHGAVHGARVGKDCDGSQHHQGELFGADVSHCA